jgi:hypothetical protein
LRAILTTLITEFVSQSDLKSLEIRTTYQKKIGFTQSFEESRAVSMSSFRKGFKR